MAEGRFAADHIRAELGAVIARMHPGRTDATQITLFKSLGLAVEDVAAAHLIYCKAQASGAGTWIAF